MKTIKHLITVLALLALHTTAVADTVVLRAAHVFDVDTGKLLSPGVVVVNGNLIEAVNPAEEPAGAEVIELPGMTLMPGFIDTHTHLTSDLEEGWEYRGVEWTAPDYALLGVRYSRMMLLSGFTTVRDLGSGWFTDVALMHAIERGDVDGPRIIPSGYSIGSTGGHCDVTGFAPGILELGPEGGIADGKDEILKAMRYQIKHGAQVIKICATAGVLSHEATVGAQQYSEEELRAVVDEAKLHGVKVAAHAHGTQGIIAASNAGVDSIEHGSLLDEEAVRVLKKNGTWLVPTLFQWWEPYPLSPEMHAKNEYIKERVGKSMELAFKAGVKVALGTDAGAGPHGRSGEEFTAYVKYGMKPEEAIRTGTVNAVELLGVTDRGRLKAGLLADVVAVKGNPVENIRILEDVKFVMKDGKVYKRP